MFPVRSTNPHPWSFMATGASIFVSRDIALSQPKLSIEKQITKANIIEIRLVLPQLANKFTIILKSITFILLPSSFW